MKTLKHDWVQCTVEVPKESSTKSGIVLSPAFKPTKIATVVKSGPGSNLKPKERILVHAGAGIAYEKDAKLYILIRDLPSEIIGIV